MVENIPLGMDHRLRKQVPTLLDAGYRVTVVTRSAPENAPFRAMSGLTLLEHPPFKEPRHAAGYLREYTLAFGWAALLCVRVRLRHPVHVVQFCQPPDIYFPLAWLLRLTGATVVVDQRDLMPELFAARYTLRPAPVLKALRWLERRTQCVADRSIVVNDHLRDRLIGAGANPRCVAVVRNGPLMANIAAACRAVENRDEPGHLLCWAGKMGRQDRLDLLLEVCAELVHRRRRTDCRFLLLGDGECLEDLRRQARSMALEPWVSLPGWLSERELYLRLAEARIGLDTSLQPEVSPVKAMEYMAFGLPVVAFDLPETAATVRDGGVFVPPGDVDAFADAVEALLGHPARRAELGLLGRRRVAEELSWERQAATYLSVMPPPPSGSVIADRQRPHGGVHTSLREWSESDQL
ncbi:glycosyltransferase family 4 protein [Pseudonocardia lutea]|uniref:Glycosyltransferase family 4 protein n=1 Tax=Pseudonocardia lutea TaxID=2172015 RepID=A0ABW1IEN2_9PSEU